jgi:hypothetical protein
VPSSTLRISAKDVEGLSCTHRIAKAEAEVEALLAVAAVPAQPCHSPCCVSHAMKSMASVLEYQLLFWLYSVRHPSHEVLDQNRTPARLSRPIGAFQFSSESGLKRA